MTKKNKEQSTKNNKTVNKKKLELTPEAIARFEKMTGAKVVDVGNGNIETLIIEYEGKRWRPIKNRIEIMCASFDNEQILMLGNTQWIGENWNPNENDNDN